MSASLASENMQGCSLLEELPRELVWIIIEYAAESISELRLTSSTLRSRVDDFALNNSTFCVVDELIIERLFDLKYIPSLLIAVVISSSKCSIFKLRIAKFGMNSIKFAKLTSSEMRPKMSRYQKRFIIEEENNLLIKFGKCFGKRIAKISIEYCEDKNEFDAISNILEGIRFRKLRFVIPQLSRVPTSYLLEMLKAHASIDLTLCVDKVVSSDPVKILLDLSTLVESLHITQAYAGRGNRDAPYFFDLNIDWAPTILEMFSRRLSKLNITNYRCYLLNQSAEALREHLPLLGKKICFKICAWAANEYNDVHNEHFVNVATTYFTVKHATRVNESFDIYNEPTELSF